MVPILHMLVKGIVEESYINPLVYKANWASHRMPTFIMIRSTVCDQIASGEAVIAAIWTAKCVHFLRLTFI
ncbi:hypothetical protein RP20_CCG008686 [Aedes albopictus]|nr:hypothetical protein RP20_CCG008686 [Aedes albopictus]